MSESGPEAPEPVEPPKPEAPVAVVVDAQTPDTPVTAEGTPAAPETADASKKAERKIGRVKDKSEMDRAVMRTKMDEMDRTILDLQTQIGKEKDTGNQARLRDKLAEKVDERKQAYAEYKEMIKSLDVKIVDIQTLKGEIDALKAFIKTNESTQDPEKIRELADKTRTLDDKEKALKKLIPSGNEGDVEATLEAYKEERNDIRFEEARREKIGEADRIARLEEKDREQADRDLERSLAEIFPEDNPKGETPPPDAEADEKKDEETPLTEKEKTKEREKLLDNKIDQIAFDMAKMLAGNVPKETDTMGKFSFEAKRGLLMVLTFLGSDPAWAMELSEDERKALGMTVTPKADAEGNTIHTIKWEPLDLSANDIQDVYEAAFGKDGWEKQMKLLTPTTKFKELQDQVALYPKDTKDSEQQNMIKFVKALEDSGATPSSGVQEYIKANGDEIMGKLNPKPVTPDGGAEAGKKAPEHSPMVALTIENIGKYKFHESTTMANALDKIYPDGENPYKDVNTSEEITAEASKMVEKIKTKQDITDMTDDLDKILSTPVEYFKSLGLPDILPSMKVALVSASAEMDSKGELSTETKAALRLSFEPMIAAVVKMNNTTLKELLEKDMASATEVGKKEDATALAALKANNPPVTK